MAPLAPGKQHFGSLDEGTQKRVLANQSIPYYESLLVAACASGDDARVSDVTNEYNRARGLPVAEDTTETPDTPDSNESPSDPSLEDRYTDMNVDALNDELAVRDLDLAQFEGKGSGKDGYLTANNKRDILRANDDGSTWGEDR